MNSVLSIKNLKKYYGKIKAVDGITFELYPGEVVGLIGPNGAGKSTTLKTIVGLLRKTEGEIKVCGYDYKDKEARKKLSYIPEIPDIYPMLTVWEHMKFIALAYNLDNWEKEALRYLEAYDLLDKKDELGANLSKGMRQKVMVICGLLHKPEVMLFDEPFVGLDPKAIRELKDTIRELKKEGKSVLLSTHMLDSVQNLGDRVLILKAGKLIYEGTLEEVMEKAGPNGTLEDLFLEVTK
ncbi:ABC transporter ATP-binding protein [Thermoanaerobacter sp. CM-CNRG TB177]|uniref:ABC transporter ATP-binding protein n=1 Tax=Thermoanaerobacter sp. CM-CNRG TB177 TaxID=2800659 RepID=UPI0008EF41E9|nr:ABC transporter ATP-binding protein [Thermoanaerobacter sp. CM-CNRG TB177]MBT1279720.1 ABC transporter ATP-binding protein [Thermoanaerobacter sp. CM-CNRG TB177]SFE80717.1 ABC-type multidrug transport system, ATPase component [Thermoanaerobacter thermohydrosulfuricus]